MSIALTLYERRSEGFALGSDPFARSRDSTAHLNSLPPLAELKFCLEIST